MAQIIGLPKLSPTMEEGVLVRWVKQEGDSVEPGDLVAEVETDKANMDFNLEDEGVLLKLLVQEGDTVKLGAPVAILGDEGEDIAALVEEARAQVEGGAAPAGGQEVAESPGQTQPAPAQAEAAQAAEPEPKPTPTPTQTPRPAQAASPIADAPAPQPSGGRILASPLAKSLALDLGVDLRQVQGTGPGGRIVERDVQSAAAEPASAARPQAAQAPAQPAAAEDDEALGSTALTVMPRGSMAVPGPGDEYVDKPVSNMRRTIAERLTAAKRDVPHFRVTSSFEAAPLLSFRKRLNELLGDQGKVTINDLLVKGVALALRRVPEVNAAFLGEAIRYYTRVHVGVAVALDRGLITPVVRNADLKGIGVIGAEVRDLVHRAKNRQIKADEIQGSTFTVSNLGMFGVDHFDGIINPPEAAILAVGRIVKQPVVTNDDRITIGQRMNLTLSCDHRVVDGAIGARFLDELVELLERPESLAL